MSPSLRYTLKPLIYFLGIILLFSITSCRSHKKAKMEPHVIIEETIEILEPKGKEKGLREKISDESLTWIGTPYGFGRSEKGIATDCSGMVITIYEEVAEIKLPRNSAEQADFCEAIEEEEVDMADLVFFATGKDKNKVSHVGIMLDRQRFIHASGSKGVIISEMTTPYYRRNFLKYGRILKK